jgi:hypothetical protein
MSSLRVLVPAAEKRKRNDVKLPVRENGTEMRLDDTHKGLDREAMNHTEGGAVCCALSGSLVRVLEERIGRLVSGHPLLPRPCVEPVVHFISSSHENYRTTDVLIKAFVYSLETQKSKLKLTLGWLIKISD